MALPRSGHPRKATLGPGPSSVPACLPGSFLVCLLTQPGGRDAGCTSFPSLSGPKIPSSVLSIQNGMGLVSVLGLCLTGSCLLPSSL